MPPFTRIDSIHELPGRQYEIRGTSDYPERLVQLRRRLADALAAQGLTLEQGPLTAREGRDVRPGSVEFSWRISAGGGAS
jgi:hypothetical protein